MTKYLIEDGGQLYTVSAGALVSVSGSLSAALFQSDGFDDLQNIGALLITLTAPTVHAWDDTEPVALEARVTAVPPAQDIITNPEPLIDVVDVSNVAITYTGNPLFSFQVNGGSWQKYDTVNQTWITAGANDGNTAAELQAFGSAAWLALFTSATTMRLRVSFSTTNDTLTSVVLELVEE